MSPYIVIKYSNTIHIWVCYCCGVFMDQVISSRCTAGTYHVSLLLLLVLGTGFYYYAYNAQYSKLIRICICICGPLTKYTMHKWSSDEVYSCTMVEITEIRHGVAIKFPNNWSMYMIILCLPLTYRDQSTPRNLIWVNILGVTWLTMFNNLIIQIITR